MPHATEPKSQVFLLDCMEGMRNTPDKYYDLAVVDPPYGIGASDYKRGGTQGGNSAAKCKVYAKKDWDNIKPQQAYFDELKRISKHQIIWGANHYISQMPYDSSSWIVWDKDNGNNTYADCELAWTSHDKAVRKFQFKWHGMLQQDMANKEQRIHPTQKPVGLYSWIYANYLPNGGKVLDTHLGSGSNRIAAYKRGNIDFTGYEIDKDYYEAQEHRFKMATSDEYRQTITKQANLFL